MAGRVGITPDFETSKWQIEREFKNPRNWKVTEAFANKKDAQEWEKKKVVELGVKSVKHELSTKLIRIEWRGYFFEHDGPRA